MSGFLDSDNAIVTFIHTIPFNLYAILTILMMVTFVLLKQDLGKMRRNERIADQNPFDIKKYVEIEFIYKIGVYKNEVL